MTSPLRITATVVIPADAIEMTAVRSAGPGGQNVNKVSSKVQLRVQIERIEGLSPAAFERLMQLAGRRLDSQGRLLISSQRTRDQLLNLQDAHDKIRQLVTRALEAPTPRRPTRPTRASVRRRVEDKRRQGERKKQRRGGDA